MESWDSRLEFERNATGMKSCCVFAADVSVHGHRSYILYTLLKRRLCGRGVPDCEIKGGEISGTRLGGALGLILVLTGSPM